jgi:DNA-binding XRE family transcriptional regulator
MKTSPKAQPDRRGASHLALCRLARGYSQEELAAAAGIRRETLSYLERGKRGPRLTTARALVRVLDYPLELVFPDMAAPRRGDGAHAIPSKGGEGRGQE